MELVQYARARGRVALIESIITDKDWRAKAWYLERIWPEEFGPVAHRVIVKESLSSRNVEATKSEKASVSTREIIE